MYPRQECQPTLLTSFQTLKSPLHDSQSGQFTQSLVAFSFYVRKGDRGHHVQESLADFDLGSLGYAVSVLERLDCVTTEQNDHFS